ncbi:MAG: glutamyl-tRNA reductase [Deltaproteobacteria bacterium]|nr:glutamyl-tRNA reductase [Deltaproteobacteria bacterium]
MARGLVLVGLNHKTAPVEVRERFALSGRAPCECCLVQRGGVIREALVLSTCNRVEFLVISIGDGDVADRVMESWAAICGRSEDELRPHVYIHRGLDAVLHLFQVASSLDSMVLGEPQILGQLKEAYRTAVEERWSGVILNRLMHKAFSVAKRVRTETAIASSAVSISYAAVELAKRIFGDLSRQTVLLVGAGEMAELAATHLKNTGIAGMLVANRTLSRGQELARAFGAEAVSFEGLLESLVRADIVISSTGSPVTVIRARDVQKVLKQRRNRPMFFIDIAVPRDIDPDVNGLDNVYLYDIDDLQDVVQENLASRREEASRAQAIIEDEVAAFERWLRSLELTPTIVDLNRKVEDLAEREIRKTLKSLGPDVDPRVEEAVRTLALSLAKKVCHGPMAYLKRQGCDFGESQEAVHQVRRIFGLDEVRPEGHGTKTPAG